MKSFTERPAYFEWDSSTGRWRGYNRSIGFAFSYSPAHARQRTANPGPLTFKPNCRFGEEDEGALRQLDPQQCDAGIYHQRLHHVTGRAL